MQLAWSIATSHFFFALVRHARDFAVSLARPSSSLRSIKTGWSRMHGPNEHRSEPMEEVGAILALGLQRLLARQSSSELPDSGESSLHISPDQSGDPVAWESGEQR
jgi:hypothetical protein